MQEALTLFDSICNSRWFVKTSIVRSNSFSAAAAELIDGLLDSIPEQDRLVRREVTAIPS